jgi:hypothetical protein
MLPRLSGEFWHLIRERLSPCPHAPSVTLHHKALRTAGGPRAIEGGAEDASCVVGHPTSLLISSAVIQSEAGTCPPVTRSMT